MPFLKTTVSLETHSDTEFKTTEDVKYEGKCGTHTVPAGFVTDFASVPPMVQWLIPSYGLYALAAIVHDWYCVQLKRIYNDKREYLRQNRQFKLKMKHLAWGEEIISSRDVDAMFRRMMRELEVPFVRRWVMWTGVRWGAMFNRSRRQGILADLPMMLLWSVLAFPIVAPVSILAGIALVLDKLIQTVVR